MDAIPKQAVLKTVSDIGLRTTKGKKLSPQSFNNLLRHKVYTGWIEVTEWGERQRGDFSPIVSELVFEQVQALLAGKRPTVTPHLRNHPDFPLRNFVRCGKCGRPLTGNWSKGNTQRYAYYRCYKNCPGVNLTKERLEQSFLAFLERLQPRREYLKLFKEAVLSVWHEKQAGAVTLTTSIESRLKTLADRRQTLQDAFIYEKRIDKTTYETQLDSLQEEMTLAEMELREAKLDESDVESVLKFAEYVMGNVARMWVEFSSDQKQRLQKVLFPEAVTWTGEEVKTDVTCGLFNLLREDSAEKTRMATLLGIEPRLPP